MAKNEKRQTKNPIRQTGAWLALLRARRRAGVNTIRFASRRQRITWLMLGVGWSAFLLLMVWEIVIASRGQISERVLESVFFYIGLLMVVSAAPQVFAALFVAGDLPWLLAAPVSVPVIASTKILDGLIAGSRIFIPILLASWLALSWVLHLSPLGWLVSVVVWGLFTTLSASLTCLLLLGAVALLGTQRVQSSLLVFHIGVPILVLLMLMFSAQDVQQIVRFENLPLPAFAQWLPSKWASKTLLNFKYANIPEMISGIGLLLGTCLGVLGVGGMIGSRLFQHAELFEAASQAAGSKQRAAEKAVGRGQGAVDSRKPPPHHLTISPPRNPSFWRAILRKDWWLVQRDPLVFWQVMTPLLLTLMPIILLVRFPEHAESDELRQVTLSLIISMLYLQTSVVSLSSVGLEGRAFWIIRCAPITPLRYLLVKWAFCVLMGCGVASVFTWVFGLALRIQVVYILLFWLIALLSGSALSGIGIGLSAMFPRFAWDNPSQRVSIWALLWGFGLYLTYVGLLGAIGTITYRTAILYSPSATLAWCTGGLYVLLLSAIAVIAPLVMGAWRLERYDWEC